MGMFYSHLIVMAAQLYTSTITHQNTLKRVSFVVCQLHLTKAVLKIHTHIEIPSEYFIYSGKKHFQDSKSYETLKTRKKM